MMRENDRPTEVIHSVTLKSELTPGSWGKWHPRHTPPSIIEFSTCYYIWHLFLRWEKKQDYHHYTYFNNRNIRNRGLSILSQHLKTLLMQLGNECHGTYWIVKFCRHQVLNFIVSCILYNILLLRFVGLKFSLQMYVSMNVTHPVSIGPGQTQHEGNLSPMSHANSFT